MSIAFHHVDAFSDTAFGGNPAGVCLLDEPASTTWMAAVAAEVNVSETAFSWPLGPGRWGLRWWTPKVEVPLCGHATLATAHVLRETGLVGSDPTITFETASGELTATFREELTELDFPAYARRSLPSEEVAAVRSVLGDTDIEVLGYGPKVLVALAERRAVEMLVPDLVALANLDHEGLVVTADAGGPTPGYVLRYFAPAVGVDEDPVTGSAQCAAGPYWRERTGVNKFAVEQVSTRRGRLVVTVGTNGRVTIAGRAVTIIRGSLAIRPT